MTCLGPETDPRKSVIDAYDQGRGPALVASDSGAVIAGLSLVARDREAVIQDLLSACRSALDALVDVSGTGTARTILEIAVRKAEGE